MREIIKDAWEQARSIESIREEDGPVNRIGEIRKKERLYIFYRSASGKYWYETRIGTEELTEYESIFGRRKHAHNSRG